MATKCHKTQHIKRSTPLPENKLSQAPQKPVPVAEALASLDSEVSALSAGLAQLLSRVEPVIGSPLPALAAVEKSECLHGTSPVATAVIVARNRVRHLADQINEAVGRLEI